MKDDFLRIGVVTSPHGVHGEVKVYPTTDEMERFQQVKEIKVSLRGVETPMTIDNVKYFKGMAILKLSGINTMDEAEKFRNADLLIHRSQSSPCKEGQHFIVDLIGMDVENEQGEKIGVCTDVYETGANNVYEVTKTDGKMLLLPVISSCILNVDEEQNKMTVYVLPGLED